MTIERYCTETDCPGGDGCRHKRLNAKHGDPSCVFEYVASQYKPEYRWTGEGPPPRRWRATDGTIVYRSFADYCD